MKALIKKLKSNNGESLAETLVALLISTFGMMILAGALVSSMRLQAATEKAYTNIDASNATISQVNAEITIAGVPIDYSAGDAKTEYKVYESTYTSPETGQETTYYYWLVDIK